MTQVKVLMLELIARVNRLIELLEAQMTQPVVSNDDGTETVTLSGRHDPVQVTARVPKTMPKVEQGKPTKATKK